MCVIDGVVSGQAASLSDLGGQLDTITTADTTHKAQSHFFDLSLFHHSTVFSLFVFVLVILLSFQNNRAFLVSFAVDRFYLFFTKCGCVLEMLDIFLSYLSNYHYIYPSNHKTGLEYRSCKNSNVFI